ncbi:LysR family transcriptional regulator [Salipiger mucosus]|uniref:HTH lysR-type domain-containing protein n=1 Tax=Salipiger mucosus DSM 16094 TaxID=1123237 RepID=S9QQK4_9RHOB|nr:LysR family transcriptional regulator [Salipiger mucosus]EPX83666.1 hypothetical protein Salmuc_02275 [Salipiger mucosus DSM 16094]
MNNWDDLRFLVALSKTGTMTAAARMLGTNTATVSRRIDRLSEELGMPAFVKTSEGWRPSESISSLIQLAQTFDGQLQSTLNSQAADLDRGMVTLSLGCLPIVRSQILVPGLSRRADMLDGLRITFADRIFKEGLGENDLVVHAIRPEQGRIVARKVGVIAMRLYGFADGVEDGDWAALGEAHDQAQMMAVATAFFERPPRLRVDNIMALYEMMKITRLPGPLPEIVARRDPELVPLQPDDDAILSECWLYYHESRRADPGMRCAVDWIVQCFEDAGCAPATS